MIDILLSGRLRGVPTIRKTAAGATFTSFRVAATDRRGERVLCSCVAFAPAAQTAVAALNDGDSLSISGEAAISTWQDREGATQHGLDVLAHLVQTAYQFTRKRDAAAGGAARSARGKAS